MMERVALVGPPNCGKTTLFNALTGLRQQVGNYPGVTVEKKTGTARTPHGEKVEVIDLPGAYSLIPRSPDERVTRDVLLGLQEGESAPDRVLCVVDAGSLERQMPLVLQVLEAGLPVILILNRKDIAEASGIRIDAAALSVRLGGTPVLLSQANAGLGVVEIRQAITKRDIPAPGRLWRGDAVLEEALAACSTGDVPPSLVLSDEHFLEEAKVPGEFRERLREIRDSFERSEGRSVEEAIEAARMELVVSISRDAVFGGSGNEDHRMTARMDAVLLHRFWGWPVFFGIFFLLFWSVFSGGEIPSQGIDWLHERLSGWIEATLGEGNLRDLILDGVLEGVFGVLGFLPQILILFLGMGILESCGYMARAAYLMDGVMRKVGLPGRAFVPLLSGYACALPGMMAARTISNDRDRLLTLLVLPWVGCSARLPVFVLLVSVLFTAAGWSPLYQGVGLFLLYFCGTAGALLAARVLRPVITREAPAHLLMELPRFQWPDFRYIGWTLFDRGRMFVRRMGGVIVVLSVIIWALSAYPRQDEAPRQVQVEHSYMGQVGKVLEPVFAPMGYDWRISTGILASFAAREVFNSHMGILLAADEGARPEEASGEEAGREVEADDYETLGARFASAARADGSPLFTPPVVISLMVFFVFALQCFPTVAVALRETGSRKWALLQLCGMTLTAYFGAWIAYAVSGFFFA